MDMYIYFLLFFSWSWICSETCVCVDRWCMVLVTDVMYIYIVKVLYLLLPYRNENLVIFCRYTSCACASWLGPVSLKITLNFPLGISMILHYLLGAFVLEACLFQFFSVTAIVGADCGSTIDLVVMPCSPWMEKESVHFVLVYLFNRMRSVISIIIYVILPLTRMIYIYRWFIILIFMDVIKIARSRNAITNLYWNTCMIILWSSWVTHLSISFHRSCCSR